jgi:ribosomal protein S18 acetylase RimI-like enzyme
LSSFEKEGCAWVGKFIKKCPNVQIRPHSRSYDLLLLADPSKDLIDEYLKQSDIFTAKQNDKTIGVIVLFPLSVETVEIKNVAVKPEFQGQGIGSYLIENVVQVALSNSQKSICIGTANSSIGQLLLYQKLGFEITDIKRHFFYSQL